MSGRLDRLAENNLEGHLAEIERVIQELQTTAQPVSGSSVVYFITQLPGTYDWQNRIPDPSGLGFGGKLFLVEATTTTMDFLWAGLRIDLYKGSPPVIYRGDSVFADMIAGTDWFTPYVYDVPTNSSDPRLKSWYVNISGPAGGSAPLLSVKFFVEGLDQTTIAITELN